MRSSKSVLIILCAVLTGMRPCQSLVLAQQQERLMDTVYKKSILQKIDSLIESKYVIADKARKYADEFRTPYSSGVYESCATAEEFAEQVNRKELGWQTSFGRNL